MSKLFDGVGEIVVFNSKIRGGIAEMEKYVVDTIERGSARIIIDAITTVDGEQRLSPTISTSEQLSNLVDDAYEHVLAKFSFFNAAPRDFKAWVTTEIIRRVKSQMGEGVYYGMTHSPAEAHKIIRLREQAFDALTGKNAINAAQQLKADRDELMEVAAMIWNRNMMTTRSTPLSIQQVSARTGKSISWLRRQFKKVDYLKSIRIAIVRANKDDRRIRFVRKIHPNVFARRLFLTQKVASDFLDDLKKTILIEPEKEGESDE